MGRRKRPCPPSQLGSWRAHVGTTTGYQMEGQSAERIAAQQSQRAQDLERDARMFEERAQEARAIADELRRELNPW